MKNVFKTGVVVFSLAALALTGCKKDDFVKPEELNEYLKKTDGGYITGTITGSRTDGTPYSFPFEYKMAGYSSFSLGQSGEDKILYFSVQKNQDAASEESEEYLYFSGSLNFTKKTFISFSNVNGYFTQMTSDNKKFVYSFDYDSGDTGTYNWSNINYDENTEMLTADFTIDMPDNNGLGYNGNKKATKITGKAAFKAPKESVNTYTNVYYSPNK